MNQGYFLVEMWAQMIVYFWEAIIFLELLTRFCIRAQVENQARIQIPSTQLMGYPFSFQNPFPSSVEWVCECHLAGKSADSVCEILPAMLTGLCITVLHNYNNDWMLVFAWCERCLPFWTWGWKLSITNSCLPCTGVFPEWCLVQENSWCMWLQVSASHDQAVGATQPTRQAGNSYTSSWGFPWIPSKSSVSFSFCSPSTTIQFSFQYILPAPGGQQKQAVLFP